jgi:hypothetical protein
VADDTWVTIEDAAVKAAVELSVVRRWYREGHVPTQRAEGDQGRFLVPLDVVLALAAGADESGDSLGAAVVDINASYWVAETKAARAETATVRQKLDRAEAELASQRIEKAEAATRAKSQLNDLQSAKLAVRRLTAQVEELESRSETLQRALVAAQKRAGGDAVDDAPWSAASAVVDSGVEEYTPPTAPSASPPAKPTDGPAGARSDPAYGEHFGEHEDDLIPDTARRRRRYHRP